MPKKSTKLLKEKTWESFRDSGMLWWANRIMQIFGWVIVLIEETAGPNKGKISRAYPARTVWRGFVKELDDLGISRVSTWMLNNAKQLYKEARE